MLWGGAPKQLLAAAAQGRIEIYTCAELLAELLTVLQRTKFSAQLAISHSSAPQLANRYHAIAYMASLPAHIPGVCRDPKDDVVLACADSAGADAIVSGDKDLLSLGAHGGIRIMRVIDAILLL